MNFVDHAVDHTCPNCGVLNELAANFDEDYAEPPKEGDLSFCLPCGAISVFGPEEDNFRPRAMTEEEADKAAGNPQLAKYREAWINARQELEDG